MEKSKMKFFMIDEDLLNTIVDLMMDSVETSSQVRDNDNVMFFTWLYDELVDLPQIKNAKKFALYNKRKILMNKTKDTLTDDEIKMLNYLNAIIKASGSTNKKLTRSQKDARTLIEEESQRIKKGIQKNKSKHMSLKEIKEFLIDDPELTNEERFDLYYEEAKRDQWEKEQKKLARGAKPLDEICKELGIVRWEDRDKGKNK